MASREIPQRHTIDEYFEQHPVVASEQPDVADARQIGISHTVPNTSDPQAEGARLNVVERNTPRGIKRLWSRFSTKSTDASSDGGLKHDLRKSSGQGDATDSTRPSDGGTRTRHPRSASANGSPSNRQDSSGPPQIAIEVSVGSSRRQEGSLYREYESTLASDARKAAINDSGEYWSLRFRLDALASSNFRLLEEFSIMAEGQGEECGFHWGSFAGGFVDAYGRMLKALAKLEKRLSKNEAALNQREASKALCMARAVVDSAEELADSVQTLSREFEEIYMSRMQAPRQHAELDTRLDLQGINTQAQRMCFPCHRVTEKLGHAAMMVALEAKVAKKRKHVAQEGGQADTGEDRLRQGVSRAGSEQDKR